MAEKMSAPTPHDGARAAEAEAAAFSPEAGEPATLSMDGEPAGAADDIPWGALLMLGFTSFASSAALRFCDPLLPKLATAFSTTPGAAAAVVTTYSVAYGGFQLITGPLGDRFGKVRMVVAGSILCGLFTMACAFAASLDQVSLLRFLAGLSGAAIIPNCLAFIGDTIAPERRQAVLARYMIFMSAGAVSGQAIGGVLADLFGWHSVFLMVGAFLIVSGAVLAVQMRTNPVLSRRTPAPEGGLAGSFRQILALRHSLAGRTVLTTVTLEAAIYVGAFTFVGAHLRGTYGISYTAIGGMVALSAVGAASYSLAAPMLLARFSQKTLLAVPLVIFLVSFVTLATSPPLPLVALAIAASGGGFALFHNALQNLASQMSTQARGAAIATFAFCFFSGQTVGVFLGSLAYDRFGAPALFATAAVLMPLTILWFRGRLSRIV